VVGKAMAAAATSAAGKMPLMVENVQKAVVKALASQAPAAAAFAGMHEFERGNGFGLEEHTAFGAIAEGATADEASPGGVDTSNCYTDSFKQVQNLCCPIRPSAWSDVTFLLSVHAPRARLISRRTLSNGSIFVVMVVQWGEAMGELGNKAVATLRNVAWTAFTYAMTCGSVVKAILFIILVGLQPAAADSVAGIRHRTHAPAMYSAMHLGAHAKLDPAA